MTSYDLGDLSRERATRARPVRIASTVFSLVALVVFVSFLFIAFSPNGLQSEFQRVAFGVIEAGSFSVFSIFVVLSWKKGPGASSVSIDDQGIRLGWPRRREAFIGWERITSGFVLVDYSINAAFRRTAPRFLWEVRIWNRPPTSIPEPAFDEVQHFAQAKGLKLEIRVTARSLWRGGPRRTISFGFENRNPGSRA